VLVRGRRGLGRAPAGVLVRGLQAAELEVEGGVEGGSQRGQWRSVRFSPPPRIWLIRPGETPIRDASSARDRPHSRIWKVISLVSCVTYPFRPSVHRSPRARTPR